MSAVRNILFIMCDQLRADHLGCYGHPYLATRNIDALAVRGVRFAQAFVQSGVCGPSRMSMYTGRYVASHGATWNRVPLSIGEITLGEYLKDAGRTLALTGKTHVLPDHPGMLDCTSTATTELGALLVRAGSSKPTGTMAIIPSRRRVCRISACARVTTLTIRGRISSSAPSTPKAKSCRAGKCATRVCLPASPSRTRRPRTPPIARWNSSARKGDQPWVLHLSYVKPHWPYLAPAPYHTRYTLDSACPFVATRANSQSQHPVLAAYRQQEESANFARDEVWQDGAPDLSGTRPAGRRSSRPRLGDARALGRFDDTLIVFTADHGDFLGDHWLGEKELFYDTVQRVPLIVYDPDRAADATRGSLKRVSPKAST